MNIYAIRYCWQIYGPFVGIKSAQKFHDSPYPDRQKFSEIISLILPHQKEFVLGKSPRVSKSTWVVRIKDNQWTGPFYDRDVAFLCTNTVSVWRMEFPDENPNGKERSCKNKLFS